MQANTPLSHGTAVCSADQLYRQARAALDVAGVPSWPSAVEEGRYDALVVMADDESESSWFIIVCGSVPDHVRLDRGPNDEDMLIDAGMARDLVVSYLRGWLLQRGWQVQVELRKSGQSHWRLADCLSFAGGGGDRLDDDYPYGHDELSVLCQSVVTLGGETCSGAQFGMLARPQ